MGLRRQDGPPPPPPPPGWGGGGGGGGIAEAGRPTPNPSRKREGSYTVSSVTWSLVKTQTSAATAIARRAIFSGSVS